MAGTSAHHLQIRDLGGWPEMSHKSVHRRSIAKVHKLLLPIDLDLIAWVVLEDAHSSPVTGQIRLVVGHQIVSPQ